MRIIRRPLIKSRIEIKIVKQGVSRLQKRKMPTRCPVCTEEMVVTRLRCTHCDTAVEGTFEVTRLARLSKEHLEFVEIFLKSRGNIKEVERELGISYPTVRGRLDSVIEALGYRVEPSAADETNRAKLTRRKEILDALNRGEISSEDAVKQLKSL